MSDEMVDNLTEAEKAVSTSIDAIYTELPACMKKLWENYEALQAAYDDWLVLMKQKYKVGAGEKAGNEYFFDSTIFPFAQMTSWLDLGMARIDAQMTKMPKYTEVVGLDQLPDEDKNAKWKTIKTANHYSAYDYMTISWRTKKEYTWRCKGTLAGELQPKPEHIAGSSQLGGASGEAYYLSKNDGTDAGNITHDPLFTHPSIWWEDEARGLTESDSIGGTAKFKEMYAGMHEAGWDDPGQYTCETLVAANAFETAEMIAPGRTANLGGAQVPAGYAVRRYEPKAVLGGCKWWHAEPGHSLGNWSQAGPHSRLGLRAQFKTWIGTFFKDGGAQTLDHWPYYTTGDAATDLDATDETMDSLAGRSMWENSYILPAFSIGNFESPETIFYFASRKPDMNQFATVSGVAVYVQEYYRSVNDAGWVTVGKVTDSTITYKTADFAKGGYEYAPILYANLGCDGCGGVTPFSYWEKQNAGTWATSTSLYAGNYFGTGAQAYVDGAWKNGGAWDSSPMGDLVSRYFALKAAFWKMREPVGCILNLDLDIQDAKTDLTQLAAEIIEDRLASPDAIQKARDALSKLAQSVDDIARMASAFNKNLLFREQCYLMAHLPSLANYHKNISAKGISSVAQQNVSKAAISTTLTNEQFETIAAEDPDLALRLFDIMDDGSGSPFMVDIGEGAFEPGGAPRLDLVLEEYLGEGNLEMLRSSYGVEIEAEYLGTAADEFVEVETFDTSTQKRLPYYKNSSAKNASILLDAKSPYGFMNALSVGPSQRHLHNLTVAEISAFQPMISLYKIEFDPYTREEVATRLVFDSFADTKTPQPVETLLQNKDKRGFGTGIQSFNFTYAGSNPFAVKKSIKATLKIHSNSFDELLQWRGTYRYVDLALKTSNTSTESACDNKNLADQNENMAKLNFRLRAVIGWQLPAGAAGNFSKESSVRRAINDSFVTLNLVPTVHDFEFDEIGRVVFTINYLAYIDEFMDQNEFDIFSINHGVKISQIERRINYKKLKRQCKKDKIKALKEQNISKIDDEKKESITALMQGLIEQNKIYYINRDYEEIRNFTASGPFFQSTESAIPLTSEELNTTLAAAIAEAVERYSSKNAEDSLDAVRTGLMAIDPNQVSVAYFYVSDLLDYILGSLSTSLQQIGEKLNLKLGATEADIAEVIDDKEAEIEAARSARNAARAADIIAAEVGAGAGIPGELFRNATLDYTMPESDIHFPEYTIDVGALAAGTVGAPLDYEEALDTFELMEASGGGATEAAQAKVDVLEEELNLLETKDGAAALAAAKKKSSAGTGEGFDVCDMIAEAEKYERLAAEFKKFRLVLGPVEVFDVRYDIVTQTINIGDFPISVKYFIEFLTEKLSKKQETVYSISNFCNDFFNNLIRNFLNDDTCFTGINSSLKVSVNAAVITSYNESNEKGGPDELTARANAAGLRRFGIDDISNGMKRILNISGHRQLDHDGGFPFEHNYLIFFAGRVKPTADMLGKKSEDALKGIMHYELGRERGIVKTIKLTKTQTPGLQEVRFEQGGYDGLRQLRVIYDVNIDTYADVHAYPGTYIFVNPLTFAPMSNLTPCDPMNLTEYGIGGYYMIVSSEHEFGPGVANTKIFAKWVNEISGTGPNCDPTEGGKAYRKCTSGGNPIKEG